MTFTPACRAMLPTPRGRDALQIIGPAALVGDHPVSKLMRDAKLMQIFEGTNQVHRIATARLL